MCVREGTMRVVLVSYFPDSDEDREVEVMDGNLLFSSEMPRRYTAMSIRGQINTTHRNTQAQPRRHTHRHTPASATGAGPPAKVFGSRIRSQLAMTRLQEEMGRGEETRTRGNAAGRVVRKGREEGS